MFVFYNINNRLNSMIRYPKKGISLSLRDSRKQNTNITQTLIAADSNVSWHSRPVLQYSYITRMASSGETTQSKISGMSETLSKGKCNQYNKLECTQDQEDSVECLELRDNTIFIEDLSTYDVLADKRDQSDPQISNMSLWRFTTGTVRETKESKEGILSAAQTQLKKHNYYSIYDPIQNYAMLATSTKLRKVTPRNQDNNRLWPSTQVNPEQEEDGSGKSTLV